MRQQIFRTRLSQLACALVLVLFSSLAAAKAQTNLPIIPFLEEVTVNPTTGVATAYFGYNNPNTRTITIAIGEPRNFIDPLPEDRGQPTQFLRGVSHYAFASVFNYHSQPSITWFLDNIPVTADSATAVPQPQTSVFTYQGRLTDGTMPASGAYQMQFALYDAATAGTQIGSTLTNTNVDVSAGLFTVQLNFGSNPFTGADRFLEIAVKRPANAAYVTLAPRQQLTAAPFAIHTVNASSADALSNSCVGCVTSAQIGSVDGTKVNGSVPQADNATVAVTAGNVTGVVGVANGGTGSSAQNFVDLSTNQSNIGGNKTFTGILSGTFSGDGSGLSNVSGKFPWQVVAGTSQQAQANTGYVLTNANQVKITLPATPNVGDIVRVSGAGTGGWRMSQNDGQSILVANLNVYGASWSVRESNRSWSSVASSADGRKLVAVVNNDRIYTSSDSGATWLARSAGRSWRSVASSADGTKLIAVVKGERIYNSTDSGLHWIPSDSARLWESVASSADGTKLVAAESQGPIYNSTDSGASWVARDSYPFRNWSGVASSADGAKLVAVVSGGQIYTSIDSGVSWTARESTRSWSGVASSADGTRLVAVVSGGQIYTSSDSGVSWTAREANRSWRSVVSSYDGTKLVAVVSAGRIYTSSDSGLNWTPRESNRDWQSVASSGDGSKLVAVVSGGQIYTSNPMTTPGTAGYLVGEQFAAIELQYLGGGQFLPLSHEGTILGN